MFVGFSKRLKGMGGFRLGVGMRLTSRNWWYILFLLLFVGMFYMAWYMIIGVCWGCYWLIKLYYYAIKYTIIGCKKLYIAIRDKLKEPEPSIE